MKRILPLFLALTLLLCACGPKDGGQAAAKTPEELAQAYTDAIQGARDAEMNDYFSVMTNTTTDADPVNQEMTFAMLGFTPEDAEAYGISLSLMNVSAYAIVAVKPAEGKEETVQKGLESYIEAQKSSFEFYLEDQYDIAASAKLDKLADGTYLLVMGEGQDAIFDSIKTALEG